MRDGQTTSEDRATQLLICEALSLANISVSKCSALPLIFCGDQEGIRTV